MMLPHGSFNRIHIKREILAAINVDDPTVIERRVKAVQWRRSEAY